MTQFGLARAESTTKAARTAQKPSRFARGGRPRSDARVAANAPSTHQKVSRAVGLTASIVGLCQTLVPM